MTCDSVIFISPQHFTRSERNDLALYALQIHVMQKNKK